MGLEELFGTGDLLLALLTVGAASWRVADAVRLAMANKHLRAFIITQSEPTDTIIWSGLVRREHPLLTSMVDDGLTPTLSWSQLAKLWRRTLSSTTVQHTTADFQSFEPAAVQNLASLFNYRVLMHVHRGGFLVAEWFGHHWFRSDEWNYPELYGDGTFTPHEVQPGAGRWRHRTGLNPLDGDITGARLVLYIVDANMVPAKILDSEGGLDPHSTFGPTLNFWTNAPHYSRTHDNVPSTRGSFGNITFEFALERLLPPRADAFRFHTEGCGPGRTVFGGCLTITELRVLFDLLCRFNVLQLA